MQRVRIGLTGLACVFLLVLLAAAFLGLTNNEQVADKLIVPDATGVIANEQAEAPREPLAELGVTPGFGGDQAAANVATAATPPPPPAAAPAAR